MNYFDNVEVDTKSFAYTDLLGVDRWESFTPSFTSLTVVGATNYSGRYRVVGRSVQFQVQFSAATSVASTAGTTYLTLPIPAKALAGMATMTNDTTNVAVGICHIDTATSRCYTPTLLASGNVFNLFGVYEA